MIDHDEQVKSLQEKFKNSNRTIEIAYSLAKKLYEEGEHSKATSIFFILLLLKPKNYKIALALGVSEQKQNNYENAIEAYSVATILNINDPMPHIYASQCFYCCKKYYRAKLAINLAIKTAEQNKYDFKFIEKIKNLLDTLI